MKIRLGELRQIILEALDEAEEGGEGAPPYHELPDSSFDVKLDNFFVDTETQAAEEAGDMGESFLREAEDAPDAGEKDAPDPEKTEEKKLNVNVFSREIARLIDNFSNLMDVKGIVLRRALNYVGQKYGREQATLLQDVLETQFGIYSDMKEEPPAPGADRAGPALAG